MAVTRSGLDTHRGEIKQAPRRKPTKSSTKKRKKTTTRKKTTKKGEAKRNHSPLPPKRHRGDREGNYNVTKYNICESTSDYSMDEIWTAYESKQRDSEQRENARNIREKYNRGFYDSDIATLFIVQIEKARGFGNDHGNIVVKTLDKNKKVKWVSLNHTSGGNGLVQVAGKFGFLPNAPAEPDGGKRCEGPISRTMGNRKTLSQIIEWGLRWWYAADVIGNVGGQYPKNCHGLADTVLYKLVGNNHNCPHYKDWYEKHKYSQLNAKVLNKMFSKTRAQSEKDKKR